MTSRSYETKVGRASQSTAARPVDSDAKWTVMVFMGADTVEGNAPMLDAAVADLAEMAVVGSGDSLNIFVQVHTREEARRGHIQHEMIQAIADRGIKSLKLVQEQEADPADGLALGAFLNCALKRAKHNPDNEAHHSMLVLWGHAYDFAIGQAPTRSGTIDALDFVELTSLLRRLQEEMQVSLGTTKLPKLDVVGFDACDVATVELACELEPFAKYLLGSQIGVPIPGWPYDRVLERLRLPFGRLMAPAEFGSWVVNRFCEAYTPRRAVSLSMLDLNRAPELFARTQILAEMLETAIVRDSDTRDLVSEIFSRSLTAVDKPYVDVADLCLNLVRECADPLVAAAARALGDFLVAPSLDVVNQSSSGGGRPFVIAHGRNAGETAKLNGISLYAPHVAPANDFVSVQHLYEKFEFARVTRWSPLVHTLAGLR